MLNVTDVFCETCTDEMNIHVNNLKFATLYILLYMYHLHKVNNRGIIYSYEGEMIKVVIEEVICLKTKAGCPG